MYHCWSCGARFDNVDYYNRSEMESGHGHCPFCKSMNHSGNVNE
jgi:DNA-directed RNA polymerase subunit RPC12/RpoP